MDDQVGDSFSLPNDLSCCHNCGGDPSAGWPKHKLKRCAGCELVLYCSRECQKKAWPTHKVGCRFSSKPHFDESHADTDTGPDDRRTLDQRRARALASMGFTTTVSFAHALKDWAEAHRWAFTTMTRALVLLHGGPDALHLDSGAPQFVLYVVSPNPKRAPHEPSPVNTFRVDTLSLLSGAGPGGGGAENASLLQAWAEAEPGRRAMDASFRADGDPRFAGVVSVIYQLADTGMVVHNQHPVWRARTRTAVDDEGTQTMLRDLLGLCRGGINTGVSMRPLDERGYLPFPGVLTRTRKTWTWLPLFKERSLWTGAAAMFPSSILASGLRPEEIFRRFHSL